MFADDGLLSLDELEDVMRACLKESGMALPESDVKELAFALVQYAHDHDPADLDESFDELDHAYEALNIDQFKSKDNAFSGEVWKWLVTRSFKEKQKIALCS